MTFRGAVILFFYCFSRMQLYLTGRGVLEDGVVNASFDTCDRNTVSVAGLLLDQALTMLEAAMLDSSGRCSAYIIIYFALWVVFFCRHLSVSQTRAPGCLWLDGQTKLVVFMATATKKTQAVCSIFSSGGYAGQTVVYSVINLSYIMCACVR